MTAMAQKRTLVIREELTEMCSSLLLGYRMQCAQATGVGQVQYAFASDNLVHS